MTDRELNSFLHYLDEDKDKSLIELLTAYKNGEVIEVQTNEGEWHQTTDICDFVGRDLSKVRIKPKETVRPFKSISEVADAVRKHGVLVYDGIKGGSVYTISSFNENAITFFGGECEESYASFLDNNIWFDDYSPCGVVIE